MANSTTNKEMNYQSKTIFIGLGWAIVGKISAYVSVLVLSTILAPVVTISNINEIMNHFHSFAVTRIGIFLAFHFTDFIMAIFFTSLLAWWYGFKKLFLGAFILGATYATFCHAVTSIFYYMKIYTDVPSWALWVFCSEMLFVFVLLPLSAWSGCIIGQKFRK
jgi:hypothetical protein